jgi:glycosyltransferase involved in cell wall biosynthesis
VLDAGLDAPLVYVFHASAAYEARDLRTRVRPGRDWVSAALLEGPLRRQTAKAVEHASAVLVLSEFSRVILGETSERAAEHAVRVGGAVDTDVFTPDGREDARANLGLSPSDRVVLTVRRVEPRMGLENLLEAAGLLADVPALRVVVAGSGDTKELERLRQELDLESRVELVGRLRDDELRAWHRAADLFVLPTLAYEGFGLVTAEALASGTPVVGTPVGATPELLEPLDARLVGRGSDPPALAEAIRTGLALATPELRERCRAFALDRFSWEANLPAWERALADAVDRHRSRVSAGAGLVSAVDG